jgi:hypothetical protein
MKGSQDTPSGGTLRPDGEPPLPPSYYLDRTDPEVLTLRRAKGAVVAHFSASGYVAEAVEREAWEDFHRQRHGRPPSHLPPK